MPTAIAQALLDARMALDSARAAQIPLRAVTVAAQQAEDVQAGIVQQAVLAVVAATDAVLVESGNAPEE